MIYTPHFESLYPQTGSGKSGYHFVNKSWIASFPKLSDVWDKMAGKQFTLLNVLLDKIHKEKDNSFVFITTPEQELRVEEFLAKYELKDLIVMQTPYVTNINTGYNRRLKVTIIQTKEHFQREEKNESGTA